MTISDNALRVLWPAIVGAMAMLLRRLVPRISLPWAMIASGVAASVGIQVAEWVKPAQWLADGHDITDGVWVSMAATAWLMLFLYAYWSLESRIRGPRETISSERHKKEIVTAVLEKRKKTPHDFIGTSLGSIDGFLEFGLYDFSDTWMIREVQDLLVTKELQRQIVLISRYVEGPERRHLKVLVILLVYKSLTLADKASLLTQLDSLKAPDELSSKISFQVWGKADLET